MSLLRGKVRTCGPHGNAQPCWKCKAVDRQAAKDGTGPRTHNCSDGKNRVMRGGVCPGPYC